MVFRHPPGVTLHYPYLIISIQKQTCQAQQVPYEGWKFNQYTFLFDFCFLFHNSNFLKISKRESFAVRHGFILMPPLAGERTPSRRVFDPDGSSMSVTLRKMVTDEASYQQGAPWWLTTSPKERKIINSGEKIKNYSIKDTRKISKYRHKPRKRNQSISL